MTFWETLSICIMLKKKLNLILLHKIVSASHQLDGKRCRYITFSLYLFEGATITESGSTFTSSLIYTMPDDEMVSFRCQAFIGGTPSIMSATSKVVSQGK